MFVYLVFILYMISKFHYKFNYSSWLKTKWSPIHLIPAMISSFETFDFILTLDLLLCFHIHEYYMWL